jgi:hypothetical protein
MLQVELLQLRLHELEIEPAVDADVAAGRPERADASKKASPFSSCDDQ